MSVRQFIYDRDVLVCSAELEDELILKSALPSDGYEFSIVQFIYRFGWGIFIVRTSKILEILALMTSKLFPLSKSLLWYEARDGFHGLSCWDEHSRSKSAGFKSLHWANLHESSLARHEWVAKRAFPEFILHHDLVAIKLWAYFND